jgi:hypothetical protein
MNINQKLLSEIATYIRSVSYEYPEYLVEQFLNSSGTFGQRRDRGIDLIGGIMKAHGKIKLLECVAELARIEQGMRELELAPDYYTRDHVVHAVLSFLLGIYLKEKFLEPEVSCVIDTFQWELAGLLHDVGYPVELAKDIVVSFSRKINNIKSELGMCTQDIKWKMEPLKLQNLSNSIDSFDLIGQQLSMWGLRINPKREFERIIDSGEVCHGVVSSLVVLWVIDLLYQKHNSNRLHQDICIKIDEDSNRMVNFNQDYFELAVVPACSAIFIHNLPGSSFAGTKIVRSKAPVAFLLKLSDCLQQWERPSFTNWTGFSSNQFDIRVENKELFFKADISMEDKSKIKNEIDSTLVASDIHIE